MNSRLSTGYDFESLSSQIEVQIFYSEQGAPYCEFLPNNLSDSQVEFFPEIDFMTASASTDSASVANTSRYMMAEGGYPEMYPGDDLD